LKNIINVEDYRLDASTGLERSDTEVIELAVAEIANRSTKGTRRSVDLVGQILIPPRKKPYSIDKTIKISSSNIEKLAGVRIFGGGTLKIKELLATATQIFRLENCQNVTIENLNFDGNRAILKLPDKNDNSAVGRIWYTPIDIQNCSNITIRHCTFKNVSRSSINLDYSEYVTIAYCIFKDCFMDPIFSKELWARAKGAAANNHVTIFGNTLQDIGFYGWDKSQPPHEDDRLGNGIIVSAHNLTVGYNYINGTDRSGMKPCDNNGANQRITGNVVTNCDWQCINPQGSRSMIIDKNILSKAGKSGIRVHITTTDTQGRYNLRVAISNNIIQDIGDPNDNTAGIEVGTRAEDLVINGNIVYRSKKHGIRYFSPDKISCSHNQVISAKFNGIYLYGVDKYGVKFGSKAAIVSGNFTYDIGQRAIAVGDLSKLVIIEGNYYGKVGNKKEPIFTNKLPTVVQQDNEGLPD